MTKPQNTSLALLQMPFSVWGSQAGIVIYLLAALVYAVLLPLLPGIGNHPLNVYLIYLVGLVCIGAGWWIFLIRRSSSGSRPFTLFSTSIGLACLGWFDLSTSQHFGWVFVAGLALASGSLVELALVFPRELRWVSRNANLPFIGYLPAVLLGILALSSSGKPFAHWITIAVVVFLILGIILFFRLTLYHQYHSFSPIDREQARLVFWGAAASIAPLLGWSIWKLIDRALPFSPFWLLSLPLLPLTLGYTLQSQRPVRVDFLLSRAALYTGMVALAGAGYALLVSGLSLVLMNRLDTQSPVISGIVIFILALLLNPLRVRAQNMVDAVFFRGEHIYQDRIQTFSHELTKTVDLSGILRILRLYIEDSLMTSRLHIYIYDPLSDQYQASHDIQGASTSDIRFSTQSSLVQTLSQAHNPLMVEGPDSISPSMLPDRSRMALLGSQVYIPLPGRQRLTGWLALGSKRSGDYYTRQDLAYLEALSDQATLAIERAQVVANMENRVREMNVLARVAQGVNVTLTFDDILELIYAQTNQLLPTRDFRVTLIEPTSGVMRFAFFLQDDERVHEQENQPIPAGQDLEQELLRTRRTILAEDYARECQARGMVSTWTGIYAWMGVPLNAGAETIGTLSLGSRDPSITYTRDQLNLVQSIADQTAGAIVKARLLQESERRALQLATVNEVSRQLTSTLELEPLLQNILQSAVYILNCEAGSLLLVDPQTDEMVFRVAAGPVAENLVGRRLPAGSGVVGKSVKTREPIIVNDVQSSREWFSKTDQQTGFITQALLVTPLEVKDNVIGVIEVINKRDGLPFGKDDLALLSAFAGQAAVAIENARLYTLTDQALAERVEELSVMQRIDRELNTSLDVNLAMRITLEWAMRQSGSNAGLIGMLGEDGIQIIASQGYTDELAPYQDNILPSNLVFLQPALETVQPQQQTVREGSPDSALLKGARNRVIIPVRRETTAMGLLLLESAHPEPCSEETLDFLTRLSDHAAIAIANAQLYAAVQAANIAKSEFVSFVSHELKNPMTSIKGYTELLAAGAVGPVSEAQANFLSTIRSNVERMSTLVSDLADVSRIEAGRLRLEFKALSLSELLDEVARSTHRQIEDKSQQLELQIPKDLPSLWADRTRLVQILTNLVSNATKYTPQSGRICIGAAACQNEWDPNGARYVIHIWVQDTGIGISPEDQKKIFQKFFRSEDPKTREVPGTGLGLNITRSLVEMQGGRIWFESEFRQGTTFHFTLPVAE